MTENIRLVERWMNYTFILKLISTALFGVLLILLFFTPLKSLLGHFPFYQSTSEITIDFLLLILLAISGTGLHTFIFNRYLDIFFTMIFMIKHFHIKYSFSQAKNLSGLFDQEYLNKGSWVSIFELTNNDPENNKEFIYNFALKILNIKSESKDHSQESQ